MEKIRNYLLINLAFFIYSITSVVSKINALTSSPFSIRFFLIMGVQLIILVIYTVLWQICISKVELTIAFAFKGITAMWGMIFAAIIFKETITLYNIIGTIIIIMGIIMVVQGNE